MENSILRVPICVNGGENIPNALEPRELFLTNDGKLFFGNSEGKPLQILAKELNHIVVYSGDEENTKILELDPEENTVIVGGLKVTYSNDIFTFSPSEIVVDGNKKNFKVNLSEIDLTDVTLDGCELQDVGILVGRKDVLYGDDPEKIINPREGQIFFKVAE